MAISDEKAINDAGEPLQREEYQPGDEENFVRYRRADAKKGTGNGWCYPDTWRKWMEQATGK